MESYRVLVNPESLEPYMVGGFDAQDIFRLVSAVNASLHQQKTGARINWSAVSESVAAPEARCRQVWSWLKSCVRERKAVFSEQALNLDNFEIDEPSDSQAGTRHHHPQRVLNTAERELLLLCLAYYGPQYNLIASECFNVSDALVLEQTYIEMRAKAAATSRVDPRPPGDASQFRRDVTSMFGLGDRHITPEVLAMKRRAIGFASK